MLEWIIENKTWLFSGLAVVIPLAIIGWLFTRPRNKTVQKQKSQKNRDSDHYYRQIESLHVDFWYARISRAATTGFPSSCYSEEKLLGTSF